MGFNTLIYSTESSNEIQVCQFIGSAFGEKNLPIPNWNKIVKFQLKK